MSLRRREVYGLSLSAAIEVLFLGTWKADTMISISGPYQALSQEISSGNSLFFSVKVFFFFNSELMSEREGGR